MRYKVTLNGTTYEVEVEKGTAMLMDEYQAQAPAQQAPAAQAPAAAPLAAGESIAAPMPGVILSVNVSQGQNVKSGQILCILEAMKMENEIVAPRDGVIAQVVTSKGANVDTGAPLFVLQ